MNGKTYTIICNHTRNYKQCQQASGCFYLMDSKTCTCDYGYGINQEGKCEQCINNSATNLETRQCTPCTQNQISFYGHLCVTPQQCTQMNGYVNEEVHMCKCQPGDVMDPLYGCLSYQKRLEIIRSKGVKKYNEIEEGFALTPNNKQIIPQEQCKYRNGHILQINPKQCICKGDYHYYEHKNFCVYPYNTKFFEPSTKRQEFLEKYLVKIIVGCTILFSFMMAVLSVYVNDCIDQKKKQKEAKEKEKENKQEGKEQNHEATVEDDKKED